MLSKIKRINMRTPYQILLFPFIREKNRISYALFKRADRDVWQGIAGGGENNECPLQTVKREAFEEGKIPCDMPYMRLSSIASIPVEQINGFMWGEDIAVIPEYTFGVELTERKIDIGHEHTTYEWFSYDCAQKKLTWDSNKTALWELHYRITHEQKESSVKKNTEVMGKYF